MLFFNKMAKGWPECWFWKVINELDEFEIIFRMNYRILPVGCLAFYLKIYEDLEIKKSFCGKMLLIRKRK